MYSEMTTFHQKDLPKALAGDEGHTLRRLFIVAIKSFIWWWVVSLNVCTAVNEVYMRLVVSRTLPRISPK